MKKLLIMLAFCAITLYGQAQEHLTFKGIPITGTMTEFCQKLKNKGLKEVFSIDNGKLFTGDFTGRQAKIYVSAVDNGKYVERVSVAFDDSDTWNTLLGTYTKLKNLYTEKYGTPYSNENNPSRSDSNTGKMLALDDANYIYFSSFDALGGTIEISIRKALEGICKGFVMILYIDNQNEKAKHQSDLDEI